MNDQESVQSKPAPAVDPAAEPRSYVEGFSAFIDAAPTSKHFYLWHCIRDYINRDSEAWPGVRTIASRIKCDKDNIKPWADDLKAIGWLDYRDVTLKRGRRRIYKLLDGHKQPWFKQKSESDARPTAPPRKKYQKKRKPSVQRTPDTLADSKVSSVGGSGCPAHTGHTVQRTPDISQGAHQVSSPDVDSYDSSTAGGAASPAACVPTPEAGTQPSEAPNPKTKNRNPLFTRGMP